MKRPAEVGGVIGSIGFLVARLLGVKDADTVTAIGTVVGFVPAAITWLVITIRARKTPAA